MKRLLFPTLIALFQAAACSAAQPATTPFSQLHVLSIHVKDHATFDAVFRFLGDVLELPRVYGEVSKPGQTGRLYAGFSVGNGYLEPCGPYDTDPPFSADRPARFHGLTFAPAANLDQTATDMERLGVVFSRANTGADFPDFIYVTDPVLAGPQMAVSVWQIKNTNDHTNLRSLATQLREAGGGPLGIQRLDVVQLRASESSQSRWARVLGTLKRDTNTWVVGDGPGLRVSAGEAAGVEGIELKVRSIKDALQALTRKGLRASSHGSALVLDPTQTHGLSITLREP